MHSALTFPGVSAPSRVVRSTMVIAVSIAQRLEVVLMLRVASMAARASAPTWSTPESEPKYFFREASVPSTKP